MSINSKRQPVPFGKYLLLDRVNIGGMAEVWRAKSFGVGGFERLVAIKRILPNIAEDTEFIAMFIDEAKITVQLNHANIAQIYELNNISKAYFIAMEYVSGKDMRSVFERCRKRGEPAPIALTCYVIAQCCEGLDYAHRAKDKQGRDLSIVHRDVSPQNALISYDGEVKVIDFGIAKAAGKASKTQAGILKGKFGYMSPEQIRGLPLDGRSDIFAMGVCLYEMLTGERLFIGDSDFSVLEKVRKVEIVPPSHFNRKIPEALERVVLKALAKEVEDRYQHCIELGEDLRKFMYSTGNAFTRKDLAAFMRATFAEDFEKERVRIAEYGEIKAPEGMLAAAEMGLTTAPILPDLSDVQSQGVVTAVMASAPVAPGPVLIRPPSSSSMPRLTAATPSSTRGKTDHESTVLANGPHGPAEEPVTKPSDLSPLVRASGAAVPIELSKEVPELKVAEARPSAPRSSTASVPALRTTSSPAIQAAAQSFNVRLIVALAAIVAVLLVGLAIVMKPAPTGLIMLEAPEELAGKVTVQIGAQVLPEPILDFPHIRSVPVGNVTVKLTAPGYQPLVETVEVKEGGKPATLTKTLIKKKQPEDP